MVLGRGGNTPNVSKDTNRLVTETHISGTVVDLFGRLKTTMKSPQFTYQNEYNKGEAQWVEKVVGTATATHNPTNATVYLTVNAEGDKIIRQTRQYFRYYSGKTLSTTLTWWVPALPPLIVFRAGYFENENGIFFAKRSTGLFLCLRNNGVDIEVPRAEWDDRLDKTGPSRQVFDFDKSTIFQINLQWLGVGDVQCIIEASDGTLIPIYTFRNVGVVESTYMRTANLPIRYELEAETGFTGTFTVEQICSELGTEDGDCYGVSSYPHTISNGTTAVSVTTTRSTVLAFRPKETFNGIINRATTLMKTLEVVTAISDIYWELVYNPTYAGTPTWNSVNNDSTLQFTTNATTITGGIPISSGYGVSARGQIKILVSRNVSSNYPLGLDIDGLNPTSIALVATSFSGTAVVNVAIDVEEVY